MANTSAVYARIDTNLKDNAESILSQRAVTVARIFYGGRDIEGIINSNK